MDNMDYWIEHRSRFTGDAVINNGAMIYLADEVGTQKSFGFIGHDPQYRDFQ